MSHRGAAEWDMGSAVPFEQPTVFEQQMASRSTAREVP